MRKYEREEVAKYEDVLQSITCNKCGKIASSRDEDYTKINLIHNIKIGFGYGSTFDMESWNFDLCEDCLFDLVRSFKHKPDGFSWEADYPDEVWKKWKETGEIDYRAGWTEEDVQRYIDAVY